MTTTGDPVSTAPASVATGLIRSMRPKQWAKNVLVFAAPVAAGVIRQPDRLADTLIAFVAMSLAASGTYLWNDARDVASDRQHPTKRNRPIAAGTVPVTTGWIAGGVLIATGVAVSFLANAGLALIVATYLVLTATYTFWLKFEPIVDIVAVAAGFVLRAMAGAAAAEVPISEWFYIVASTGALLMVTGKREGELSDLAENAASIRATLGVYTPTFLLFLRSVFTGLVLIAYYLWAFESANAGSGASTLYFRLSCVPFSVAILRYALLIDQGKGSEPENVVLGDRGLLVAGAVWAIIYAYGIYVA